MTFVCPIVAYRCETWCLNLTGGSPQARLMVDEDHAPQQKGEQEVLAQKPRHIEAGKGIPALDVGKRETIELRYAGHVWR